MYKIHYNSHCLFISDRAVLGCTVAEINEFITKKRIEKISLMAFILLSIVAIFATGSRTPMLVIAIFLIAYFLMSSEMKLKKKTVLIVLVELSI